MLHRKYLDLGAKVKLNHQMFVYNQAYNICLNLWKKEQDKNKNLDKKDKIYRKAVSYDRVIKRALRKRKIKFSTVVTQQARINFSKDTVSKRLKAIEKAITPKEKAKAYSLGFPAFKSSKDPYQSFNWNNQGYQINDKNNNERFKILRLLKTDLKLRYHRKLPDEYKLCSINISKDAVGYYVSFGIEFKKLITNPINKTNFNIDSSIGIDLNAYNIAVSKPMNNLIKDISEVKLKHLIDNGSTKRKSLKYNKLIKILERKQSRRVLKAKKSKIKLGANHKRTQRKLNKLNKNITNSKKDLYHKISTKLTNKFDMIVGAW